jgi:hypothetical protein
MMTMVSAAPVRPSPTHVVEGVVLGCGLPQVMREDDTDLILTGNSLQTLDGAIVGGVGLLVPACRRPYLGERIDANQPPFRVCPAPLLDVPETALIEALPLGMQLQALRPRIVAHQFVHAPLQAALVILKREVEIIALHRLLVAKYKAVARSGYANIEHKPRFPDLGLAREDRNTLGDKIGEDDPHRLELLRLKFARGYEPIAPRLLGMLHAKVVAIVFVVTRFHQNPRYCVVLLPSIRRLGRCRCRAWRCEQGGRLCAIAERRT